jgi:hypothetical protein
MSRVFAPISQQELQAKVEAAMKVNDDNYYPQTPQIVKDLKVEFDTENFEQWRAYQKETNNVMGIHTLPNNLTFWGMCGGGDWEHPVHFIIYWSGKELRAYVPTEGNLWNTDTKQAYGNDEDADYKNIKKRFFADTDPEDIPEHLSWEECPSPSGDKMIADIVERILPVGQNPAPKKTKQVTKAKASPKKTKQVTKAKASPKKTKTKQTAPSELFQAAIEALTFYSTGDEAYELFQAACSFCYQLYGLGDNEKAGIVYGWAKEMAEASEKWARENLGDEWDQDKIKGHWGY